MSASPPRATKVVMQPVPSIKDRLKQLQPSHVRATTCAYSMPCGNAMLLSLSLCRLLRLCNVYKYVTTRRGHSVYIPLHKIAQSVETVVRGERIELARWSVQNTPAL